MDWYSNNIVHPALEILKKETKLKELKDILKWCDEINNKNDPILQKEEVVLFLKIRNEIKSLPQMDEDFLIAFDATSLYPSAMWDENSEFPDISSGRAFKNSEEKEILELFNTQKFRPRTGFFKVKYHNPRDNFLQHLPIKETIRKPKHAGTYKMRGYKVNRFRNGYTEDH